MPNMYKYNQINFPEDISPRIYGFRFGLLHLRKERYYSEFVSRSMNASAVRHHL